MLEQNKINKFFLNNDNIKSSSGLVIVDSKLDSYLILQINNYLVDFLDFTKEQVKSIDINSMMPKLVADQHNRLIKSYFNTGNTSSIGKQQFQMVKKKDGQIYPCEIYKKLYFSQDYGLAFICTI